MRQGQTSSEDLTWADGPRGGEVTVLIPAPGGTWLALSRAAFDEAMQAARELGFGENAAINARAEEESLLDAGGLAQALGLKRSWVEQAARDGRIPCIKAGRYPRFHKAAVLKALEAIK